MEQFLAVHKALADKNRIRILKMLESRYLCVCEIAAVLGLAFSTTSKHLSILKDAGLIFEQKDGKWVNYHLDSTSQKAYVKETLPLITGWLNDEEIIKRDRGKLNAVDRNDLCGR